VIKEDLFYAMPRKGKMPDLTAIATGIISILARNAICLCGVSLRRRSRNNRLRRALVGQEDDLQPLGK
jgi:hypothetical protein